MGPLADLHRHLDGSLRPATLEELAAKAKVTVPPDLKFSRGMGLQAALSKFAFTLSLLQSREAVRRVAAEICEDAAAEGVTTLEIRFAPHLHKGADPESMIDAALEGIRRRAGLIVCGLYGEPVSVLNELVEVRGIAGIDLAGGPSPGHTVKLQDYARPFARAMELGLGRTVHAGEGRSPEEIRTAIEKLHANRIGHGTTLLDDPKVLELVVERKVTIEACPTSNVHTGIYADTKEHPLPKWLAAGVRACICTDNTLLSGVDARAEHRNVAAIPGMTPELVETAIEYGHAAAFDPHR